MFGLLFTSYLISVFFKRLQVFHMYFNCFPKRFRRCLFWKSVARMQSISEEDEMEPQYQTWGQPGTRYPRVWFSGDALRSRAWLTNRVMWILRCSKGSTLPRILKLLKKLFLGRLKSSDGDENENLFSCLATETLDDDINWKGHQKIWSFFVEPPLENFCCTAVRIIAGFGVSLGLLHFYLLQFQFLFCFILKIFLWEDLRPILLNDEKLHAYGLDSYLVQYFGLLWGQWGILFQSFDRHWIIWVNGNLVNDLICQLSLFPGSLSEFCFACWIELWISSV